MTSRLLTALVATGLVALATTSTALAHGTLVTSDPPDGGTIASTPYTLTATFAEEIDAEQSSIVVENAAGAEVARGALDPDDATQMIVDLPVLGAGQYTVRWTTVTPDDQGVERGTFTFDVGTPGPTAAPSTPSGSGSDVLVALVLAAVAIGAVVAFVFLRSRR
jgi:methionine-rich copper-binding protein CopC